MTKRIIRRESGKAVQQEPHYLFAFLVVVSVVALFIFYPVKAYSGQATLTWDAPTKKTDGTPLTNLAGFRIYFGTSSGNYSQTLDVGNATTYTVSSLNNGATYYFAVTAYDTSGNESDFSNQMSKTIVQQYSLSVAKIGTGTGTVTSSLGGINCGTSCSANYDSGTVVTLTASSSASSDFMGWSGGGCAGAGTCSLSISANMTVTANFAINRYTLTALAGSGGSITPPGTMTVNHGENQSFSIAPATYFTISNVQVDGASLGAVSSYSFTNVVSSHAIYATFNPIDLSCGSVIMADGTYYSSLGDAFGGAQGGSAVKIAATNLVEVPNLTRNVNLSLAGGYNCGFGNVVSFSTLEGAMVISHGSVTLANIIIK